MIGTQSMCPWASPRSGASPSSRTKLRASQCNLDVNGPVGWLADVMSCLVCLFNDPRDGWGSLADGIKAEN